MDKMIPSKEFTAWTIQRAAILLTPISIKLARVAAFSIPLQLMCMYAQMTPTDFQKISYKNMHSAN